MTVGEVHRVAVLGEPVELDEGQLKMVADTCDRVQQWGRDGTPIYGVTTAFGELIHLIVPPRYETELQENLLRTHAAGGGPVFPEHVVRAMQVSRLNCLLKGYSGISADALLLMAELLNRRIHPVVPQQGSLGASGDLAPLSHLALPLIGAGRVTHRGVVRPSAEVLAEEGLLPVKLGYKDGLALINGTSGMTAVASLALVAVERLLRLALWASGVFVQAMRGSTSGYNPRGHALKNHAGQSAIAVSMMNLLEGSDLTREHAEVMRQISESTGSRDEVTDSPHYLQDAYSVRCVPQILGPVVDAAAYCRRIVEEELNSCNDNPLIFETPETVFHGGHFHGQYVAMACDFLNIAVTEVGVLAERQLNRLLDPHLNGSYPPFLALGEQGLFCGMQGAQYLATSIASENLDLAAPASVKSIPSNGQNQDVVSMGLIAARKSLQLVENVHAITSVLAAGCYQAASLLGIERFSPNVRGLLQLIADNVRPYRDDEGVAADFLADIRDLLRGDEAEKHLPAWPG
ncbi:histidine ammonia-lyase [Amycolatopsis sp. 195334CR]|uniref:HAL/PAL/TAL family ammonia-lyase n=1 Tax=Amycolatopsis sp. 195334CR TaxID=2814588 RepID=UPI001A8F975A|nr:aromatic amino acid ammonia-lyase [Amycolatopsis sp. 195334CR]MBN6041114.1 aromatic amino acid lyase [Amycolatopsis sp. 195334CR]